MNLATTVWHRGARLPTGRLWTHTLPVALTGACLLYGVFRLWLFLHSVPPPAISSDHDFVMGQAARILAGGPVYETWEMTQPIYPGTWVDLYPPPTVFLLFVPMSLVPAVLWWAIPLTVTGAVVWRHRPSAWGWAGIMALLFVWPHTWTAIQLGNPVMWIAMFVALGTVYGWPAILVLLKPTLAPFALIGVRSRTWWIAGIVLGLVSLATIPAWLDYLTVVRNLTGFDPLYSAHDLGIVLIPVVARIGATRPAPPADRQPHPSDRGTM